jgi:hypothetical protein
MTKKPSFAEMFREARRHADYWEEAILLAKGNKKATKALVEEIAGYVRRAQDRVVKILCSRCGGGELTITCRTCNWTNLDGKVKFEPIVDYRKCVKKWKPSGRGGRYE